MKFVLLHWSISFLVSLVLHLVSLYPLVLVSPISISFLSYSYLIGY